VLLRSLLIAALAATTLVFAAAPAPAKHDNGTKYEGRVVSVNRDARSFRLRDHERGTVTIRVTRSTEFERLSGFSALRSGRKVEATTRRVNGRLTATKVEGY
jgi:Cu/Ag efflux protein CusF